MIVLMLILPAYLALVSAIVWRRLPMLITLIWSLPFGIYLALAAFPSIWSLFGVVLLLYLCSFIRMAQKKQRSEPKH
ncbi:hypothetical protein [Paenibacillus sinopodophylli]|uniref:hypothetical protein n=1 Tax=Paenibacillus sinopodophylli TaxID=1837342 RepID=UPI00110C9AA5|nr:hypothetical protein [Paenibacillus sinopodophylli]